MTKIKTIIIDDEPDSIQLLEYQLKKHFPQIQIAGSFTEPQQAIEEIEIIMPDILFLDIEMPVMNGFELLEKIMHLNLNVVFITAYNQFAIKAFRFNALDYLLKPVEISSLKEVIEKLNQRTKPSSLQIEMMQKQLRGEPVNKIAIPSQNGITFISLDEILYAEASGSYTKISLTDKRKLVVSKTLKDVTDVLEESHFLRIHRHYIINLNHVKNFIKNDNLIIMNNNDELPIARTQKDILVEKFKWF
jgi:two-component system LytT family response regulator